jgi:excisionase family DNA binding protein
LRTAEIVKLLHMGDRPEFLDLEQAAELLHTSPRTLRRWVAEGKVPVTRRLGRKLLFSHEAIRRHLEAPAEG